MANEPSIEFTGYCGDIRDFRNGGCIIPVAVTPSYKDKQSDQWKDKPTLYFDVSPLSNQAKDCVDQIRQYRQQGLSVKVLVNGSLSKRVSEKDGKRYENLDVAARTIAVLSAKPKNQNAAPNGQLPNGFSQPAQPPYNTQPQQPVQQTQPTVQQPQTGWPQQPSDPWAGGDYASGPDSF